ncbi:MAG: D-xylose ABC transporter substrate-binding protein [Marivivens sp.]|uniref:D-xylose ABC transporter substrate-binding protein n=1 Tax=Marivivens sp. TaxID=1978374 RepID=UPI00182FB12A|nr:D-xylose ABC transporter substrate-binding protein [Marivivens sp.]NVJ95764.1 D-xylose ABC transporter substrate-binding protein [Marivivens sp.]
MMKTLMLASVAASGLASAAAAADLNVCVSWSNFREERWKTDEAAIVGALNEAGANYISADAQTSATKQLADIEGMITQGCSALIVLAQDSASIGPALDAAEDAGIPVVGYDRMIDDSRAFYLTFDNVEVGRMQARAVLAAQPTGRYVMIKGSPVDPNADFLRGGQQEVLQAALDAGQIEIVGEAYTDDWQPANAQKNMEQILTQTNNGVDAVVASNDGTAGGVVAALTAQGMEGIPVSGQDGDMAALNRVALGTQTVSVWKDSRALGRAAGEIAVALASGTAMADVEGSAVFTAPSGTQLNSVLLAPQPITRDNLNLVLDAGWISKETLCAGVTGVAVCE